MTIPWTKIPAPTPNVNVTMPSVVGTPIGLLLAITQNIPESSIVTTIWTTIPKAT